MSLQCDMCRAVSFSTAYLYPQ